METTYRYTGLLIVHSSTRSGYRWTVGLSYCHPSSSHDDEHDRHILRLLALGMGFTRMGVWRAYCSSILTPPHPFRVPGQEPSCRVGLPRNTRVSGLVCGSWWGLFQYEIHQKTAKPAQILEESFGFGWLCTCWYEQGCYLGCSLVCGCMRWWGCFYA